MKDLFLDANAHKPMSSAAVKALVDFNNSSAGYGHPMSPSMPGREASNAIEKARTQIANLIGAESSNQIFFTTTCTQACEWSVYLLHKLSNGLPVYISPAEHPAIKQAARSMFGNELSELDINKDGVIYPLDNIKSSAICIHVQNELGVIEPLDYIKTKYLLSDMCQTLGKIPLNLSSTNVDIAIFGAHKFGGPASVGFVYLKDTSWWSEFDTGSRYFMDRAGTPDAASIVATAAALDDAVKTLPERMGRMLAFRNTLETGLKELGFEILSANVPRVPNTTFVSMPNGQAMRMLFELAEHGVHVGLGSACGSAYAGASPLMKKLGRDGNSYDYMRISNFGEYASSEAQLFLDKLKECIS